MRRCDEEKGVGAHAKRQGHVTMIGLIMNTISPRALGCSNGHTHAHTHPRIRIGVVPVFRNSALEATCCSHNLGGGGARWGGAPTSFFFSLSV